MPSYRKNEVVPDREVVLKSLVCRCLFIFDSTSLLHLFPFLTPILFILETRLTVPTVAFGKPRVDLRKGLVTLILSRSVLQGESKATSMDGWVESAM